MSALFLLLNILMVLLSVAAVDRAEKKYALKQDHSFNRITTLGALTKRTMSELREDVHIYALFTPGEEDHSLIGLLERYDALSDRLSYSVEDLSRNPLLATKLSDSLDDSAVSTDCLIVHCADTDRTRVLDGSNYIAQSYDIQDGQFYLSGLNYEKSITEAILYVTAERLPTVQVLTGHDELDSAATASLEALLRDANYAFVRVDLLRGDSLDPDSVLMLLSPRKDLNAAELSAIEAFSASGGSLFITSDFDDPFSLENFDALLRAYGIVKREGLVVARADATGSYFESPAYLLPYMDHTEPTEPLIAAGKKTLLLAGARAFAPPDKNMGGDLIVQTVLSSGTAYLRQYADQAGTLDWQEGEETGTFPLALLSQRAHGSGTRSMAFIIGNSSVFTDNWLYGNTYSAEFLMSMLSHLGHHDAISLEISSREAVRQPLLYGSPAVPIAVVVLLPLLVLAVAARVLMPRKWS